MSEEKTVALRAVVGFHGVSQNEIIHANPYDPHYAGLLAGGFLTYAYPEDDPAVMATILQVNTAGEETTILGVRPARRRRRSEEVEYPDGTPDPEST